jgi:plasmid stabilization system protein ParE
LIAEENPKAAADWVRGLFDSVRPLTEFPEMGRVVPEVGRSDIREIMFRGYRIVYRVAPRFVEILTVRHGKRRFSYREVGASKPT